MQITSVVTPAIAATGNPSAFWPAIAVIAAAVVAALIALIGHMISRSNARLHADLARDTANQTNMIARKNAELQTELSAKLKLAEMRQAWINSLRDDMAAFQSLGITPNILQGEQQEFYRLGTRIELFMNPLDEDFSELQRALYAFLAARDKPTKYAANPAYVSVCQRILKREWDVLKRDIESITVGKMTRDADVLASAGPKHGLAPS